MIYWFIGILIGRVMNVDEPDLFVSKVIEFFQK